MTILLAGLAPAAADPAGSPVMTGSSPTPEPGLQMQEAYGRLPLYFIENRGQVDQRVKFYAQSGGQTTWFTKEGVMVSLSHPLEQPVQSGAKQRPGPAGRSQRPEIKTTAVGLSPVGLRKGVELAALGHQEHKVNYFIGNNPKKWRTDVPTYQAVVYREAYPGIDLKFYGDGGQLEYDIIVKPGADPNRVKFRYVGVKSLEVTPAGDLAINLPDGAVLVQKKPVVYQEIAGSRVPREAKFKVAGSVAGHTYGFEVAAYDKTAPLIIDPVIVYSTYLGGSTDALGISHAAQVAYAVQVDASGCAYVLGVTYATNFPKVNPLSTGQGGSAPGLTSTGAAASVCFITKFNAAGNGLVYSTYLGGAGDMVEISYSNWNRMGLAVDAAGYAYATGYTGSTNFPTTIGAAYTSRWSDTYKDPSSWEGFVTKLGTAGNSLVFSTYMRGNGTDIPHAIAVDSLGNAYIGGYTESGSSAGDVPDPNSLLNGVHFANYYSGSGIPFVTKLNPGGTQFLWTKGLVVNSPNNPGYGGTDNGVLGIVAEPINAAHSFSGGVWVTGDTSDPYFPTVHPVQSALSGSYKNAFVSWLDSNGTIRFSTFWGDTDTGGEGIARDPNGGIYVCGYTDSNNFPVKNAWQPTTAESGTDQGILFKLSNHWSSNTTYQNPQILYSTYFGGAGWGSYCYAVAGDKFGYAYITGFERATNFPLKNPIYSKQYLGGNLYVAKLGFNGSKMSLIYSTFIGYAAAGPDQGGFGIALDGKGNAFVTGSVAPGGPAGAFFPLVHAYQSTFKGGQDAFLTKLSDGLKAPGALQLLLLQ